MAKAASKKPPSKTEILTNIASATDLSKKDVQAVLNALNDEIKKALSSRGPGVFALPGLVKIEKRKQSAKPKQVRPNPFKPGEMMEIAAKPASVKIKVRALKGLKGMI
jgi:nucleoid DNA-binding protein